MTELALRPADQVMDIKRLGAMHQTRLSFMRRLIRQMSAEQWQITTKLWDLDDNGFGTVVYQIDTPSGRYSHVLFADFLDDELRSDRVIAERWDVTMALCIGEVSSKKLAQMRANVPLQEAGRATSDMIVLSRGNKSSRNFEYVVEELSAGKQPSIKRLAKIGYLYRTTAVYGSGKFGLADWHKVKSTCPDLAYPFAAEMLSCYLLRQFSIEQAEHLAKQRAPESALKMDVNVRQILGIGNATGLGMAPFLIKHPLLISRWVLARETALAQVKSQPTISVSRHERLDFVLRKAHMHFKETQVDDVRQNQAYATIVSEVSALLDWLEVNSPLKNWGGLVEYVENTFSLETQELLNSVLLELYPELESELQELPGVDENSPLMAEMPVQQLRSLINSTYAWALKYDFQSAQANHYFWYVSEEKSEPRLGRLGIDDGAEKQQPLVIARRVQDCLNAVELFLQESSAANQRTVAEFLLKHPEQRDIVKRIQTMANEVYGEIRVNLADKDMLPLDLLRCKLSFFGVAKFDPKSSLWVRNTMFQGAPTREQLSDDFADDWFFVNSEDFAQPAGADL